MIDFSIVNVFIVEYAILILSALASFASLDNLLFKEIHVASNYFEFNVIFSMFTTLTLFLFYDYHIFQIYHIVQPSGGSGFITYVMFYSII